MEKTPDQIRQEIEAIEGSMKDTWEEYQSAMDEATKKLEQYREEAQLHSELAAEEFLILTKERGKKNG